jgi:hypothetical protein
LGRTLGWSWRGAGEGGGQVTRHVPVELVGGGRSLRGGWSLFRGSSLCRGRRDRRGPQAPWEDLVRQA